MAEDKIHGSLATITMKPAANVSQDLIAEAVNEILGRYAVKQARGDSIAWLFLGMCGVKSGLKQRSSIICIK